MELSFISVRSAEREAERLAVLARVKSVMGSPSSASPDESATSATDGVPGCDESSDPLDHAPPHVPWREQIRLGVNRRATVTVVVFAIALAAMGMWWISRDNPRSSAVTTVTSHASSTGISFTPQPSPASTSATATPLVVDVVGKVAHQGVYRLPAGSRVGDAVTAAGGALPGVDLSTLNLAQKLSDGQQVAVGVLGAGGSVGAAGASGTGTGALLDLNTATVAQLDALPGVGPVMAQKIVDWRTKHGKFDSVEQLHEVGGIGNAKFADLKPLVTV